MSRLVGQITYSLFPYVKWLEEVRIFEGEIRYRGGELRGNLEASGQNRTYMNARLCKYNIADYADQLDPRSNISYYPLKKAYKA